MVRPKYCFVAFSLLLLVTLSGCTPWATWPRIEGSPSLSTPTYHPIPRLCVLSVGAIREELGDESPLVINQLPGLNEKEAEEFMVNFPGATNLTEAGPAYHLMSVQVRVVEARVEILVPTETGKCDLWVVELRQQIKNWKVESTRRFRVQRPAPAPQIPYPLEG